MKRMEKVEIALYSLFAIGIVCKLFKLPMHTVFILTILLTLFVYYAWCLTRKSKDFNSTLTGFVTVLWLFCLLAILKHFPFESILFLISLFSCIGLLFLLFKNRAVVAGISVLCVVVVSVTLVFKLLPAHKTYYLTNIKFNYEIERDYFSWDRYSWYLYSSGKKNDALLANKNAEKALENSLSNSEHTVSHVSNYRSIITEHRSAIENNRWLKYR